MSNYRLRGDIPSEIRDDLPKTCLISHHKTVFGLRFLYESSDYVAVLALIVTESGPRNVIYGRVKVCNEFETPCVRRHPQWNEQ